MKINDASFKEMVGRLQSGELTRSQAAETYGIGVPMLNVWISRAKLGSTIPDLRKISRPIPNRHVATGPVLDPDNAKALREAVAKVLSEGVSALSVSNADPRVKQRTLAKYVREAKIAAGEVLPVRTRAILDENMGKAVEEALDASNVADVARKWGVEYPALIRRVALRRPEHLAKREEEAEKTRMSAMARANDESVLALTTALETS